jgi:hypothetical protein
MDKPKRGRPRTNFRPPILADAQVLALQTPQQIAEAEARARDAERKRLERQREREAKTFGSIETKEALWQLNRSLVPEAELDALLERQEAMFDLTFCMRKYVDGVYELTTDAEDRVPLTAIAEEVELEVKQYGVVTMEIVLLDDYWKTPLYEKFQSEPSSPTSIFARLGVVTAIPSHSLHNWEEFMDAQMAPPTKVQSGNGYTTLACKCGALPEAISHSIADRYQELGITYRCQRCRDLERKSRAQSTLYARGPK